MEIIRPAIKNAANVAKHGLDFDALTEAFFEGAVILPAKLGRAMAIGEFDRRIIVVVFQPLGTEGLSLVSMRPASRKEREIYAAS